MTHINHVTSRMTHRIKEQLLRRRVHAKRHLYMKSLKKRKNNKDEKIRQIVGGQGKTDVGGFHLTENQKLCCVDINIPIDFLPVLS